MMHILAEKDNSVEQIDAPIRELAKRHMELTDRLRAHSSSTPEVQHLRAQAAAAIEHGDYDGADAFLSKASEEQLKCEQQKDEKSLRFAEILAQRGELALTRLRYWEVAEHFAAAALRVPPKYEKQLLVV